MQSTSNSAVGNLPVPTILFPLDKSLAAHILYHCRPRAPQGPCAEAQRMRTNKSLRGDLTAKTSCSAGSNLPVPTILSSCENTNRFKLGFAAVS